MQEDCYIAYKAGKDLLKIVNGLQEEVNEDEATFYSDLKFAHAILEENCPEYLKRYTEENSST